MNNDLLDSYFYSTQNQPLQSAAGIDSNADCRDCHPDPIQPPPEPPQNKPGNGIKGPDDSLVFPVPRSPFNGSPEASRGKDTQSSGDRAKTTEPQKETSKVESKNENQQGNGGRSEREQPQKESQVDKYSELKENLDNARKAIKAGDLELAQKYRSQAWNAFHDLKNENDDAFSAALGVSFVAPFASASMFQGAGSAVGRAFLAFFEKRSVSWAFTGFGVATGVKNDEDADISSVVMDGSLKFIGKIGNSARSALTKPAKELLDKLKRSYIESGLKKFINTPQRGFILTPDIVNSKLTWLAKKIGAKPDSIIYSSSPFGPILSYKYLKKTLEEKGKKALGIDSNHLLLSEWFKKGPSHLKGLEDYVPAIPLENGLEHQGTFHSIFNTIMREEGLFQKSRYTQTEIENAILKAELFYRHVMGGPTGKAFADACMDFRLHIFNKVAR